MSRTAKVSPASAIIPPAQRHIAALGAERNERLLLRTAGTVRATVQKQPTKGRSMRSHYS